MKDREDSIEETNPIEEGLGDLSVADEQADEAKGGVAKAPIKVFMCPSEPSGHV